jgi:hypothetical protein
MISHTMIVSFDSPILDPELDQFLSEMKKLMLDSGHVETFESRRHIRIAGDDHAPLFVATAIVRLEVAEIADLDALFAVPGTEELIGRWQARFPYKVVWANHEPLP